MTESATVVHNEQLHQSHHAIVNCLSVISMGMEALKDVRDNDGSFVDICQAIERERRRAKIVLDELLNTQCTGCKSQHTVDEE